MSTHAGRRNRTSARIEILRGRCGRAEDERRSKAEERGGTSIPTFMMLHHKRRRPDHVQEAPLTEEISPGLTMGSILHVGEQAKAGAI